MRCSVCSPCKRTLDEDLLSVPGPASRLADPATDRGGREHWGEEVRDEGGLGGRGGEEEEGGGGGGGGIGKEYGFSA